MTCYLDGIGGLIFIMVKIMISKNGKNCEKLRKMEENCESVVDRSVLDHIILQFPHYRYHNKLKKERDNKVSLLFLLFLKQSVIRQFHLLLILREHFIIQ